MTLAEAMADERRALPNVAKQLPLGKLRPPAMRPELERSALRHAIASISQGVLITGPDQMTLSVNKAFEQMTGYTEAELLGRSCKLLQGPATSLQTVKELRAALNAQEPFHGELLNYKKDGTEFWNELSINPVFGRGGELTHFVGIQRDVSERKIHQAQIKLAAQVFAQGHEGIMVMDERRTIVMVNQAFTDISGYAQSDVQGKTNRMFSSGWQDESFYQAKWHAINSTGRWQGEVWHRRKCGSELLVWLTITAMHDEQGRVCNYIGTFSDISGQLASRERISWLSHFDTLTNLPNRTLFMDRLGLAIKRAQRTGLTVAVLLLDIDHFKEINDTLGHDQGDRLLVAAAQRLRCAVRDTDTVARLGGDEFAIIVSDLQNLHPVKTVAQNILDTLAAPFALDLGSVYVSASVGIALCPTDAVGIDTLLKSADQAMYAAKASGRNCYSFYTHELQDHAQNRLWLANELRSALVSDQFWLAYQPILNLKTGTVRKAEALIRWQHPVRGLISPSDFIPVAESTGLIVDIGEWVFRTAAAQVAQLRNTHAADFQLSVNKSPAQFHRHSASTETWNQHLVDRGLSCQSIVVEITEGLLLEASQHVDDQLRSLREAGVQVSLDDFGTGYSSLAYLQKHDIDYVKIDQSFVRNLVSGSKEMTLCEAIIAMAHKLDIQVIAEGIETTEQLDLLRDAGCDYGQGYLFARPMSAQAFDAYLAQSATGGNAVPKG
ncbi:MAG: EAL domain-containing protein [Rhodoferax sp.]|nr:EAL domain-containing protein [Rhodoferax sp.]